MPPAENDRGKWWIGNDDRDPLHPAEKDATEAVARALDPYAFADHWNDRPYVTRRRAARADAERFLRAVTAAGMTLTRPIPPGWNPIPPEGGYTAEDF